MSFLLLQCFDNVGWTLEIPFSRKKNLLRQSMEIYVTRFWASDFAVAAAVVTVVIIFVIEVL